MPPDVPENENRPEPVPSTMSLPILVGAVPEVRTIGIALEIPEPWSGYLRQCRHSFGDPLALSIPPHITLLPPTPLPLGSMDEVQDHLSTVAAGLLPFEVHLAGTDTFRPVSPVVFVTLVVGADDCDALQKNIRTGPLDRDLCFPYHPHVTVAHNLTAEELDTAEDVLKDFSAVFVMDGFDLYELGDDGMWRSVRHFTFGGETPTSAHGGGQ